MRVLWLTNQFMPDACARLKMPPSIKGGWMSSLFQALKEDGSVRLGVVSALAGGDAARITVDDADHFILPVSSDNDQFQPPDRDVKKHFNDILEVFNPDLIHVHGTEKFYGFLARDTGIPALVSIQGLLHVYADHYFGGLPVKTHLKNYTLSDLIFRNGVLHREKRFRQRAEREKEIIRSHRYFTGRSLWDRAHLRKLNPEAAYFHCHELMRPPFYSVRRDPRKIIRHSILTPTSEYPLKGMHWLLKAAAGLKGEFPDLRIKVADAPFAAGTGGLSVLARQKQHGYRLYLAKLVDELGLKNIIQPTGPLDGGQMAEMMAQCHVVAIPSMAENGCNVLHEAMLVGTPCTVSMAGGMISMIDHETTALGFQPGDAAMLAECIRRIFTDDQMTREMVEKAREIVLQRHDKDEIVRRTIAIYEEIISREAAKGMVFG